MNKNNTPPKNNIHYKNNKIYQIKEMNSSIQSKMLKSKNDNIDKVIQVNSI